MPDFERIHLAVSDTYSFDEFVAYGRENVDTMDGVPNIVNGMPWSFKFKGHPVTHESDDCYIVGTPKGDVKFRRGEMLVVETNGNVYTYQHGDVFPIASPTLADENNKLRKECDALKARIAGSAALSGTSPCAKCGLTKILPYRRDDLGGYVCLTCVEAYLNRILEEVKPLRERLDNIAKGYGHAFSSAEERVEHCEHGREILHRDLKELRKERDALKAELDALKAAKETPSTPETEERAFRLAVISLLMANAEVPKGAFPLYEHFMDKAAVYLEQMKSKMSGKSVHAK